MDYSKLESVTVHNQAEMDDIPLDFKGRIYINCTATVFIKNKYYWRVVARENSSVVARENSSVEAWENSSVVAWENSSVVANSNVQVVNRLIAGKIVLSGNAREVFMPKNINEFMDYYRIKHTKITATFYKAVRKNELGVYHSDYDNDFKYEIGKPKTEPDIDTNIECECGTGIHIAHLAWALDFGAAWKNLAILEVETKISDIVMPKDTNEKVRTSKIKVIREVPLEECGIYGIILAKRRVVK